MQQEDFLAPGQIPRSVPQRGPTSLVGTQVFLSFPCRRRHSHPGWLGRGPGPLLFVWRGVCTAWMSAPTKFVYCGWLATGGGYLAMLGIRGRQGKGVDLFGNRGFADSTMKRWVVAALSLLRRGSMLLSHLTLSSS